MEPASSAAQDRSAVRGGLLTSLANPKLAVFYVALFPQFIPRGDAILPAAIAMGVVLVTIDLIWYSTLAAVVAHAADRFIKRWLRRAERLCGTVLVGLGVRLALESR